MKRFAPYLACLAGILALVLLVPEFNDAQPKDMQITRAEAERLAIIEAKRYGIPVERAWPNTIWVGSALLDKELGSDPDRQRRAADDPVLGPRLGGYRVIFHRKGLEKFPNFGHVYIAGNGDLLAVRLRMRPEEPGGNPKEHELRARADAFVNSRTLAGAPNPVFEEARPFVQRSRTDWIFRYKVPSEFPAGKVVPYLWVFFNGNQFAGWDLIEEYSDGSQFVGDDGSELFGTIFRFTILFVMLVILLIIFLRKYHAGEVGIGTGSLLFAFMLVVTVTGHILIAGAASEGTGMGSISAEQTAAAMAAFMILFIDLPTAVLVFLAWSVGESYARERWGEKLASFDAFLRRDVFNATSGWSLIQGILYAPAVAAAGFLIGWIGIATGNAHASLGAGSQGVLYLGGPIIPVLTAAADAIGYSVVAILFILAVSFRKRFLPLGFAIAVAVGVLGGLAELPMDPFFWRVCLGFGAAIAANLIFLATDLLTTAIALFFGSLLTALLPLMTTASGELGQQLFLAIGIPLVAVAGVGIAGIASRREVVYSYEDMAPHVKRIVERERVKAEIDAANRIQAALLPLEAPNLAGASVASHYRAATEIGGDYFDFLPHPSGEIGIAFGDVAGHGLTSGIVMAMAKSALLVQVEYDATPKAVMEVLNEIVIKTAPKRTLMTFFFGLLDPRTHTLRFSSAGHLDPYVFRASTKQLEALSSWGFPLGVKRREPFREHSVEFGAGDRLILYSDGLIEAVDDDGEPFGFDRFEKTITESGHLTADEIKRAILNNVKKFTRNRPPEDDQTLVVVSFDEPAVSILGRAEATADEPAWTVH